MEAHVVRSELTAALKGGATALLLHGADDMHVVVLAELAARGLQVGRDISVLSVAASFDRALLPVAIDTIPLIPQASCERAVELAVQALGPDRLQPAVHLIDPIYLGAGTVVAPAALAERV